MKKLISLLAVALLLLAGCCKQAQAADIWHYVGTAAAAGVGGYVGSKAAQPSQPAVEASQPAGVAGGLSIVCPFNRVSGDGLCPGGTQPAQYLAKQVPGAKLVNILYFPTYAVIQYRQ